MIVIDLLNQLVNFGGIELEEAVADAGCDEKNIDMWQEAGDVVRRDATGNGEWFVADCAFHQGDFFGRSADPSCRPTGRHHIDIISRDAGSTGDIGHWPLIFEGDPTEVTATPAGALSSLQNSGGCRLSRCIFIDVGIVDPNAVDAVIDMLEQRFWPQIEAIDADPVVRECGDGLFVDGQQVTKGNRPNAILINVIDQKDPISRSRMGKRDIAQGLLTVAHVDDG